MILSFSVKISTCSFILLTRFLTTKFQNHEALIFIISFLSYENLIDKENNNKQDL